jgi:surface polysaccharide O-acyltransferase-like enzyme
MIGLFLGYRLKLPKYLFLGTLVAIAGSAFYALPWRGVGVTYLVGIAFGIALSFEWLRNVRLSILEKLAPYTLGIYFIHVLVLWIVTKLHIPDLAEFVLTFTISATVVVLFSRRYPKIVRYWA